MSMTFFTHAKHARRLRHHQGAEQRLASRCPKQCTPYFWSTHARHPGPHAPGVVAGAPDGRGAIDENVVVDIADAAAVELDRVGAAGPVENVADNVRPADEAGRMGLMRRMEPFTGNT